jgi:hypothetical protein
MTPEQKAEAEAKLALLQQQAVAQAMSFQADMENQLTERLKADMDSDSWLSKTCGLSS